MSKSQTPMLITAAQRATLQELIDSDIAPQWEVETARLQANAGDPQAGLTESQRAQRNSQLARARPDGATTQTWRPILLDLNGDGVQTVSLHSSSVKFDVDDTADLAGRLQSIEAPHCLKHTSWLNVQDGTLMLDKNVNGAIDNSIQLCGMLHSQWRSICYLFDSMLHPSCESYGLKKLTKISANESVWSQAA